LAAKYYVLSINEEEKNMSRIGKLPIQIPSGVTITQKDGIVIVKGPKGELSQAVNPDIEVNVNDGVLTVKRPTDERTHRALHGLYRALINNMVVGVSDGYKRELELVGVGYRASNTGQLLELSLGYTHNIYLELPEEVKIETKSERNKNPLIILESADKQLLGQVCAKIRSFRKPEPYKGKGVKFAGEAIRRKSGKSAAK
jgi:large subunit ribosomal protein L6